MLAAFRVELTIIILSGLSADDLEEVEMHAENSVTQLD